MISDRNRRFSLRGEGGFPIEIVAAVVAILTIGFAFSSCDSGNGSVEGPRDFRQDMRTFVQNLSAYGSRIAPSFIVIPQNGHQLVSKYPDTLFPDSDYLSAIDGLGREDLFYGYINDDDPTPVAERSTMIVYLDLARANGLQVLVTDYCSTRSYVVDSYAQNAARGYVSFAADHRELDDIPAFPAEPNNVDSANIIDLAKVKNFLYLLNPTRFGSKTAFLDAVRRTNYDAVIIDLFYEGTEALTPFDISDLKTKANGGKRLVIAYMSIGEAEDYRFYWNPVWKLVPPPWLAGANPDWPGNYKVRYWDPSWQSIIYGNDRSYLKKILDAGFDGVYLDLIDAFEYFESQLRKSTDVSVSEKTGLKKGRLASISRLPSDVHRGYEEGETP